MTARLDFGLLLLVLDAEMFVIGAFRFRAFGMTSGNREKAIFRRLGVGKPRIGSDGNSML